MKRITFNLSECNRIEQAHLVSAYSVLFLLVMFLIISGKPNNDTYKITFIALLLAIAVFHFLCFLNAPKDSKRVLATTSAAMAGLSYLSLIFLLIAIEYPTRTESLGAYLIALGVAMSITIVYSIKQTKNRLEKNKFIEKEYSEYENRFTISEPSIPKYHKPLKGEKNYFSRIGIWLLGLLSGLSPFIEPINRVLVRTGDLQTPLLFFSIMATPFTIVLTSGLAKHFYTTVWIPFSIERSTGKKVYFSDVS